MKKKEKSESELQLDITRFLDRTPLKDRYTITNASLSTRGGHRRRGTAHKVGWPDVTGYLPSGRMLAIEVKTAKGILSDDQERVLGDMSNSGVLVIVARSVGDVADALYGRF